MIIAFIKAVFFMLLGIAAMLIAVGFGIAFLFKIWSYIDD